jgi:hypothetical protein
MTNEEIQKLIESKKFKRNHIPESEKVIFSISGKTIGCTQSFVCFQGMPKNGKSLFITSAIASAYTTWDIFGMKINFQDNRKRLCYVDTESSDFDFYRTLERIRRQTLLDQLLNIEARLDSSIYIRLPSKVVNLMRLLEEVFY